MACIIMPLTFATTKTVRIMVSQSYQTIEGFGASDGWNAQCVGDWDDAAKVPIAKLLFSKEFDGAGDPLGIGLSRWRFNIGAGSATQGLLSNIEDPSRRADCFLQEDGTYDWSVQDGEQWFLQQAKDYGVEKMIAWVNSPPIYYTKNGRANTDNTGKYGSSNLRADSYDDYATFLTTVLDHFKSDEGIDFDLISPVNEPQYQWSEGQEGTPWRNSEIAEIARAIDASISSKQLETDIFVAEAGSYKYTCGIEGSAAHSDQMNDFFTSSSPNYIGNLAHVVKGISSHSYWVNDVQSTMRSVRANVAGEANKKGLKVYETEYSMLSEPDESHFPISSDFDRALFLGKLIHYDMSIANCVSWSYWTAMDRSRWNHGNRFLLVNVVPDNGIYGDFTQSTSGTHTADKNLWVLGNFSRFVRPDYVRLATSGTDNQNFMCTSYLSPDSSEIVSVYVNTSYRLTLDQQLELPTGLVEGSTKLYVTSLAYDLAYRGNTAMGETIAIPARSVCTTVTKLEKATAIIEKANLNVVTLFPNPLEDKSLHIDGLQGGETIYIYNMFGNLLINDGVPQNTKNYTVSCVLKAGNYIVEVEGKGAFSQHLLLVK